MVETPASHDDATTSRAIRRFWSRWWIRAWGFPALAPGAKQESDLSWFDASRVYDISADGKTILFVELSYGQSAQSRHLSAQNRRVARRCGWAMATVPCFRPTENLWRAS